MGIYKLCPEPDTQRLHTAHGLWFAFISSCRRKPIPLDTSYSSGMIHNNPLSRCVLTIVFRVKSLLLSLQWVYDKFHFKGKHYFLFLFLFSRKKVCMISTMANYRLTSAPAVAPVRGMVDSTTFLVDSSIPLENSISLLAGAEIIRDLQIIQELFIPFFRVLYAPRFCNIRKIPRHKILEFF